MSTDSANIPREIIRICVSAIVFIGNGLIILTIKKCKSLHKTAIYLLANLAVADMLVALFMTLDAIMLLLGVNSQCILLQLVFLVTGAASAGVILVCAQSFLGIAFPTRLLGGSSLRPYLCGIALTWIAGVGHFAGAFVYMDKQQCRLFSLKNNAYWMQVESVSMDVACVVMGSDLRGKLP